MRFPSTFSNQNCSMMEFFISMRWIASFSLIASTLKSDVAGSDVLKCMVPNLNTISFAPVLGLDVVKSHISEGLIILSNRNGSNWLTIQLTNPKGIFIKKLKSFKIVSTSIKLLTITPFPNHIVLMGFEGSDDVIHWFLKVHNLPIFVVSNLK